MKNLISILLIVVVTFGCCTTKVSNKSNMAKELSLAQIKLHDIWVLESMDGELLNLKKGQRRPRLEINLTKMKIMGTDGCNNFMGGILKADEDTLKLGPIASTRKACIDMKIANRFNQLINKVETYSRKGLKLYLLDNKRRELFQFQKTD